MPSSTPLEELLIQLHEACDAVTIISEDAYLYRPPIIDPHETYGELDLVGFRKFKSALEKERIWVKQLVESNHTPENPSTNAPYLLAVWSEIQAAPKPLVGINKIFSGPSSESSEAVKIEVVAAGGSQWHKVDTVKINRLLVEFREQDSYINSDFEDSDDDDASSINDSTTYPFTPVNSITKQCHSILQMASRHRLRSGQAPKIVYRFTRLSEHEDRDPRVQQTFECIRKMGIDLRFGSPSPTRCIAPSKTDLIPSIKLNLDLSLLIALISDISHAPLPSSDAEAEDRFRPLPQPWKRAKAEALSAEQDDVEMGALEHCRALSAQLKQEMAKPLVEDLKLRIGAAKRSVPGRRGEVEFWTTAEAKERCMVIVNKIGGARERRRAARLLNVEAAADGFWAGSRHEGQTGCLGALSGVKIFTEEDTTEVGGASEQEVLRTPSFGQALEVTCRKLLSCPTEHLLDGSSNSLSDSTADTSNAALKVNNKSNKRKQVANAAKVHIPTPHTLRSLLEGTSRGMTTITANRMSVKQVVRAMSPLEGIGTDNQSTSIWVVEPKTLGELKRSDVRVTEAAKPERNVVEGSIWVMEPRSLAETLEIKPATMASEEGN